MTKNDLKQYAIIDKELKQLEQQLDKLRSQAEYPTSSRWSYSRSGKSVTADIMATITAKLVDLEQRHARKWDDLITKQQEIEAAIEVLGDPEQRALLRYRYIDGLYWEEICVRLHVSYRTVHRIHGTALQKMAHHGTHLCDIV